MQLDPTRTSPSPNKHPVSPCLAYAAVPKDYTAPSLGSLHFVNISLTIRTQNCSHYFRCWNVGYKHFPQPPSYCLANAVGGGARAHFWLMSSSLSTRTPRSFSTELLSSQPVPSLCCCRGLLHPRCRTLRLPLLSVLRLPSAHFCSLPRSLWMAVPPASKLHASHDPGMTWLRMHCVTSSGHWFGPPQITWAGQNIPSLWYVHY